MSNVALIGVPLVLLCGASALLAGGDCRLIHAYGAEEQGSEFGTFVAGGGDVNGDGVSDIIISASSAPGIWGAHTGRVNVYSGARRVLLHTFEGEQNENAFGTGIDIAGDVDRDGHADIVVGAPYFSDWHGIRSGKAYLFSGATGQLLWTWHGDEPDSRLGQVVAGAGDVDADGYGDVIVGAPGPQGSIDDFVGRAYVFSGRTGGRVWSWEGTASADQFGRKVDGAGDVDGDGYADLVVGAPWTDEPAGMNAGRVYVYSGRTGELIRSHGGDGLATELGASVAGIGDVNGDGRTEYAAGADHHGDGLGVVYLFDGATGSQLWVKGGDPTGELFGYALSKAGDFNEDGIPDVLVGSYSYDSVRGRIVVLSGADGHVQFERHGEQYFDFFGFSVSNAGDVNGDSRPDIIVGAIGGPGPAGPSAGAAYVFSGGVTADLNCDGVVGTQDLLTLLQAWGEDVAGPDLNFNGRVDGVDLAMLLAAWG